MPVCVPVKDLRDTSAFIDLIERTPEPIIVTKNGYDQFVAIRSADYDELQRSAAKSRVLERMLVSERERSEGRTVDAKGLIGDLRSRYGL
ncbi:type II toxin-antitoxin system Phd/YefM family antitoxin [Adlercreutzia sp. ZJ473]|uniref:type II toxin-antitoxin system Phd/YefM family antitoxin n=1 Tax=Adlercreutzia sp. ZJ473 TaxID=2722822 RepID=UPI001557DF9C|nr:type II toxin-antitoxin system Phd/YefM family antitoxin [Adlercreutzia sp. ZJ473]